MMMQKAINQIAGTFLVISFLIVLGIAGGFENDLIGFWEGLFYLVGDLVLFCVSYIVLRLNNA